MYKHVYNIYIHIFGKFWGMLGNMISYNPTTNMYNPKESLPVGIESHPSHCSLVFDLAIYAAYCKKIRWKPRTRKFTRLYFGKNTLLDIQ